jgi:hypothetical protein
MAPVAGQEAVEFIQRFGAEIREHSPRIDQSIGGQYPRAAGIRDYAQSWPARARLLSQHFRRIKQVRYRPYTEDSAPPQRCVKHGIASSQRSGVRHRRSCGDLRPAGFDEYDRFLERYFPCSRHECPGIAHRLHVDQDATGGGVFPEVFNNVTPRYIQHRTK